MVTWDMVHNPYAHDKQKKKQKTVIASYKVTGRIMQKKKNKNMYYLMLHARQNRVYEGIRIKYDIIHYVKVIELIG